MILYYRFQKYLRTHFALSKAEARGTFALLVVIAALILSLGVLKCRRQNLQLAGDGLPENEQALFEAAQLKAVTQLKEKNGDEKKALGQAPQSNNTASAHGTSSPGREKRILAAHSTFDINAATAEDLRQVKGIGEALSSRIVKFRDKLGGFVSKGQYKEVYGLKAEVIERLGERTFIKESFEPQKIEVNTATIKILLRHPYVTYDCARFLVRKVERYGPFVTMEEVESFLEKNNLDKRIIPYLTVIKTRTTDDAARSPRA